MITFLLLAMYWLPFTVTNGPVFERDATEPVVSGVMVFGTTVGAIVIGANDLTIGAPGVTGTTGVTNGYEIFVYG